MLYDSNARTIFLADASCSHELEAVLLQEELNGDIKPVSNMYIQDRCLLQRNGMHSLRKKHYGFHLGL